MWAKHDREPRPLERPRAIPSLLDAYDRRRNKDTARSEAMPASAPSRRFSRGASRVSASGGSPAYRAGWEIRDPLEGSATRDRFSRVPEPALGYGRESPGNSRDMFGRDTVGYNRDPSRSMFGNSRSNREHREPAPEPRTTYSRERARSSSRYPTSARFASTPLGRVGSPSSRQRGVSPPPSTPVTKSSKSSKGTCDKCDGPHETDGCPHFKRPREKHKDAWGLLGKKPKDIGGNGGNFRLHGARVVRQPGDGSCLFHSMAHGLGGVSASSLRRRLMEFVSANPTLEIAGDSLQEWIKWDANSSVGSYTRRMARGGWGGGIEMAACSRLYNVNVHVYERSMSSSYKRISCFDAPGARRTIHVLYCGGVHYDALVPSSAHL